MGPEDDLDDYEVVDVYQNEGGDTIIYYDNEGEQHVMTITEDVE